MHRALYAVIMMNRNDEHDYILFVHVANSDMKVTLISVVSNGRYCLIVLIDDPVCVIVVIRCVNEAHRSTDSVCKYQCT